MVSDREPGKRVPYISIATVFGAIICQTLVLIGNLHTVANLHRLGVSATGWASTGGDLASSFDDFSSNLFRMSKSMAYIIDDALVIQEVLDMLVLNVSSHIDANTSQAGNASAARGGAAAAASMRVPYSDIDKSVRGASPDTDSFLQVTLSISGERLSSSAGAVGPCGEAVELVETKVEYLKQKIKDLALKLEPVLKQIHRWLLDLSDRAQSYVGQVGVTLGKVQEIFDVVTEAFNDALTTDQHMIDHTYTLFDTTSTGLISLPDLRAVASMFGISLLHGDRAVELFELYDADQDQMLDKEEFGRMMLDPSTPGMMSTVLHAYAERLAAVAGPLKRAETRSEVARSVASYLQIVVAKNMTKVGWIAQALTNGSVPVNFTMAVLNQLALAPEDPDKMHTVETGAVIMRRMVDFNSSVVRDALEAMVNPQTWASEGLDVDLQEVAVERVASWAAAAGIGAGISVCRTLLGVGQGAEAAVSLGQSTGELHSQLRVLPALYRWRADRRSQNFKNANRVLRAQAMDALLGSSTSQQLFEDLLGSALPASTQQSPKASQAVNKGRPASPEVLQFAQWLASNASRTAALLTTVSYDYSARMSSVVQGPLSKIRGVADKVYMALQLANRYTGHGAVEDLLAVAESFVQNAGHELLEVCNRMVEQERLRIPPNSSWTHVLRVLKQVETSLPSVIEAIEAAEMTAAGFSAALSGVFDILMTKVPASFRTSANLWRDIWVGYYLFFVVIDLFMLFWILVVSGCILRPPSDPEEYHPPHTTQDRLRVCWSSCVHCMQGRLVNGHLCFWSIALLIELLVFIAFIVTLVLCILALLKIFIHSGCNQLYMLGDNTVCTEVMTNVKFWLTSFLNRDFLTALTVCDKRMLLTCELISDDLMRSSVFTVFGGFAGSFFTFQVIVESAIMHERARWYLVLKEGDPQ